MPIKMTGSVRPTSLKSPDPISMPIINKLPALKAKVIDIRDNGPGVPVPPIPTLETMGPANSVSALGLNGLTANSFTASQTYGSDHPSGAFDGHRDNGQMPGYTTTSTHRSIWLSNGSTTNQWLAVDFGQTVQLGGCQLWDGGTAGVHSSRMAKNVIFQVSDDNVTWTDIKTITTVQGADNTLTAFDAPVTGRHFRVFMVNNHGAASYIQIGEVEWFA